MKTPQLPSSKLQSTLGLPVEVWVKREDKHHYESHKGRSIPLMIQTHHKNGASNFVISSSGNAALAAVQTIAAHNKNKPHDLITLNVLVGNHVDPVKLHSIKEKKGNDPLITIEQVETPKQVALRFEKDGKALWLRQSTDDTALVGYTELARELAKIPNLSAVFIPTSSGTTALGLYKGFQEAGVNPQIHIIQTTQCHPMVDGLGHAEEGLEDEPASLAGGIVDKVAHRRTEVLHAVQTSGGHGWIASNKDITEAITLAKSTLDIDISGNSALSLVGLTKAKKAGWEWSGPVACLITGR